MSNQIDDGGPAFPIPPYGTGDPRDGMTTARDGLSLRDWFAGQALATMTASTYWCEDPQKKINLEHYGAEARTAYAVADAMLAARKEKQ